MNGVPVTWMTLPIVTAAVVVVDVSFASGLNCVVVGLVTGRLGVGVFGM